MTTRKILITYIAHIIFVLHSTVLYSKAHSTTRYHYGRDYFLFYGSFQQFLNRTTLSCFWLVWIIGNKLGKERHPYDTSGPKPLTMHYVKIITEKSTT